ncbi:MAG: cytochrome C oxidase subunit IV family protein [Planctomycetota bacterium]|jgi:cytochrome c oxidase subunit 4
MSAEEHANASHPYYKVLGWLTFLTIAEIVWALPQVGLGRGLMISGLALMAGIKAILVLLYYMHLKYEGKLLWGIILFPCVLVLIMICGLLPDAVGYY